MLNDMGTTEGRMVVVDLELGFDNRSAFCFEEEK
jgi:hypothetical protein